MISQAEAGLTKTALFLFRRRAKGGAPGEPPEERVCIEQHIHRATPGCKFLFREWLKEFGADAHRAPT